MTNFCSPCRQYCCVPTHYFENFVICVISVFEGACAHLVLLYLLSIF